MNHPNSSIPEQASKDAGSTSGCQSCWLNGHLEQMIRVRLIDGKWLTGKLLGFDKYTILLEAKPGAGGILVNKTAIAYLSHGEAPHSGAETHDG